MIDPNYPVDGILPKKEIGAKDFLLKYPEYDGRGVTIAILDTGVDPGAPGLSLTSDGRPKIVDVYDATGSGDVNTSKVVSVSASGHITGLSGRQLKIPDSWKNPTKDYHIGIKALNQLFPKTLQERVSKERKKETFDSLHHLTLESVYSELQKLDDGSSETKSDDNKVKMLRDDLNSRVEFLQNIDKKYEDCGDVCDVVVFHDGDHWRGCIDTSCKGDLTSCQVMTSYKIEREFATFSKEDMMNYALNIYDEGNLVEIVTNSGSHGTHVAGIAAAYFGEDQNEKNGVAPGAQIISIKIGDGRLGSMETGTSIVRAMLKVMKDGIDLVNFSYGEAAKWPDAGRVMEVINEAVEQAGVIFVSSAGNKGPGLSTLGAPGGCSSSVIGVGAYVSPPMMAANYAMLQKLPGVCYTWSSRGPCPDGSLGVCISAPGAATSPVPNWTLQGSQLMNGTSMSSPNACGGVALILSALKHQNITYNPYSVRRAIENTAQLLPSVEPFVQGYGLLRVDQAYKCLETHCGVSEGKVKFKVGVSGGVASCKMKGIYLRQKHQVRIPSDHVVSVEPVFKHKDVENTEKINFSLRLALSCEADWVSMAGHLELSNSAKQFTVKVNPTTLPEGAHFTQILAYDLKCIDKGPVFRVPITVIKPVIFDENSNYTKEYDNLTFKPAENKRFFFHVPLYATRACVKVTPVDKDSKAKYTIQCIQLCDDESYVVNEFERIVNLNGKTSSSNHLSALGNRTMEVVIGRWWSCLDDITLNISISFSSLWPSSLKPTMFSSNGIFRMDVTSFIRNEEILPSVTLKHLVTPIRPSENRLVVLNGEREKTKNRSYVHALELTYNFNKNKAGEISVDLSILSGLLYENEYEGQLWMLYNSNKRLLACGDAFPEQYLVKLVKGDFTLKLQIRHEKKEMLEKFKDQTVLIHHKLNVPINLDCYYSYQNALLGVKKVASIPLNHHASQPIFVSPLSDDKVPKPSQGGHYLSGSVAFIKDSDLKKIESFPFKYVLSDSPKKNKAAPTSGVETAVDKTANVLAVNSSDTDAVAKVVKNEKQSEYQTALYEFKTSWILKLTEDVSSTLFDELVYDDPENPAPLIAKMNALDAHKDREQNLQEIIHIAEKALSLINIKEVVIFFSIKSDQHQPHSIKTVMEKSKSNLVECMLKLGCALCDLIINNRNTPDALSFTSLNDDSSKANLNEEKDIKRLDDLFGDLYKLLDPSDSKVQNLNLKNCLVRGIHGTALKILTKQLEDKPSKELDEKVIEICSLLGWDYIVKYLQRWLLVKYPPAYLPF